MEQPLSAGFCFRDIEIGKQCHALEPDDFMHFRAVVGQESKVRDTANAKALGKVFLMVGIDMDENEVFGFCLELFCREHLTDVLLTEPSPLGTEIYEHHAVCSFGDLEAFFEVFVPLRQISRRDLHFLGAVRRGKGEQAGVSNGVTEDNRS